jgi:hypothetical protein
LKKKCKFSSILLIIHCLWWHLVYSKWPLSLMTSCLLQMTIVSDDILSTPNDHCLWWHLGEHSCKVWFNLQSSFSDEDVNIQWWHQRQWSFGVDKMSSETMVIADQKLIGSHHYKKGLQGPNGKMLILLKWSLNNKQFIYNPLSFTCSVKSLVLHPAIKLLFVCPVVSLITNKNQHKKTYIL